KIEGFRNSIFPAQVVVHTTLDGRNLMRMLHFQSHASNRSSNTRRVPAPSFVCPLTVATAFTIFTIIASSTRAADSNNAPAADPTAKLFTQYCQNCHGATKHKGDFRVDSLTQDFSDNTNRRRWLTVLEKLNSNEMPPEEKPQPSAKERQALV